MITWEKKRLRENITANSAKGGSIRCMRGKINCEEGNQRLRRKIEGTKEKEEHTGSRGKIKGAAIAEGESKMREGT